MRTLSQSEQIHQHRLDENKRHRDYGYFVGWWWGFGIGWVAATIFAIIVYGVTR